MHERPLLASGLEFRAFLHHSAAPASVNHWLIFFLFVVLFFAVTLNRVTNFSRSNYALQSYGALLAFLTNTSLFAGGNAWNPS